MYYAIKNCGISHCDIVDNSRNNRYQFAIRSVSSRVRSRSKRARDKKHQNRRKIFKLNKNKKPKRARPRARFFKVIASVSAFNIERAWPNPGFILSSRYFHGNTLTRTILTAGNSIIFGIIAVLTVYTHSPQTNTRKFGIFNCFQEMKKWTKALAGNLRITSLFNNDLR